MWYIFCIFSNSSALASTSRELKRNFNVVCCQFRLLFFPLSHLTFEAMCLLSNWLRNCLISAFRLCAFLSYATCACAWLWEADRWSNAVLGEGLLTPQSLWWGCETLSRFQTKLWKIRCQFLTRGLSSQPSKVEYAVRHVVTVCFPKQLPISAKMSKSVPNCRAKWQNMYPILN